MFISQTVLQEKSEPQGLKPGFHRMVSGTAEAMAFPK
jgi:hypothetical protein